MTKNDEFRSVRSNAEKQKKLNKAQAGTVASNNNDSASVQSFAVNLPRFSVNFRDVEDSIRPFSGDGTLAVDFWISDFEDMASIMCWDHLQKVIFEKRSLKGLAKVFIMSERGIKNWQMLKNAFIKEFKAEVNSAQLHKLLSERKIKNNESVQEYLLKMKEIASRGSVDNCALMQYVIDGINDLSVNKSILYKAKDLKEFKEKLKCYEKIREIPESLKITKTSRNTR